MLKKFNELCKKIIAESSNPIQDANYNAVQEYIVNSTNFEDEQVDNPSLILQTQVEEIEVHLDSLPGNEQFINAGKFKIETDGKTYIDPTYEDNFEQNIKVLYKSNNDWESIDYSQLNKEEQDIVINTVYKYMDNVQNFEWLYDDEFERLKKEWFSNTRLNDSEIPTNTRARAINQIHSLRKSRLK